MNQKKCPKCGEMNPAEAVMCWACYTPLSSAGGGATVATATAGAAPAALSTGVAAHDEEKEKKAVPPWQIAVIVIGLLVGIGFGVMSFMGGAPVDTGVTNEMVPPPAEPPVPDPVGGNVSPPTTGGNDIGGSGPSGPTTPVAAPFTMVAPPNPTIDWGVAAIVPTSQNIRGPRAAQLAAFARNQFRGTKNRAFQIFVFADSQSAQIFSEYQARRRGAPLTTADYLALSQIWPRCLARVEFNGGRQKTSYPSSNPSGWWNQR